MQTLSEIRAMLAERGLVPRRRFGQNFLHDHNLIRKLVAAAEIGPGDLVLEVGPGTGALTEALVEQGAEVVASEIDRDLAALLRERLGERITLIEGDCLESSRVLHPEVVAALGSRPFKLVANLPYNVASPLMTTLLIDLPECVGQYVTIQREVADRLVAKPGTKEYGPLGIIVQAMAGVDRIAAVSPSCFWPQPKVSSAMVVIAPDPTTGGRKVRVAHAEAREFAHFVSNLFTKRRKQLGTIFGRDRSDWPRDVSPQQRPEVLDVLQLILLWKWSRIGAWGD